MGDVARLCGHLRDLGERGLDVLGGDGLGAGEGGGEERVMGEEVDLARQAAGGLEERLEGGGLEEGKLGAGERQAVGEVGGDLVAGQARAGGSGRRCAG